MKIRGHQQTIFQNLKYQKKLYSGSIQQDRKLSEEMTSKTYFLPTHKKSLTVKTIDR